MDGRDFLLGPVREELRKELPLVKEQKTAFHIVMNLPALAIEFLDAFRHLLVAEPCSAAVLPTVHCYGFSKHENPTKDIQERAEAALGASLEGRCSTYLVRNVAPNKEMLCITFQIPVDVLYKRPCPAGGKWHVGFRLLFCCLRLVPPHQSMGHLCHKCVCATAAGLHQQPLIPAEAFMACIASSHSPKAELLPLDILSDQQIAHLFLVETAWFSDTELGTV